MLNKTNKIINMYVIWARRSIVQVRYFVNSTEQDSPVWTYHAKRGRTFARS